MSSDIILIGPVGAGKSTLGKLYTTFDFHEHFTKHHSNHDLAKFVVYTKGKTPEETCDEIVGLISPLE